MAPKRKKSNSAAATATAAAAASTPVAAASTPVAAASSSSVLRRSPRLAKATVSPPAADQEPPKKKKTKTAASTSAAANEDAEAVNGSKTIIIEHCTQCSSFKARAMKVKNRLKKDIAGVNVVVNPENPRGCFEIREEGGEVVVSLLNMKRLDMEALIADIVQRIR